MAKKIEELKKHQLNHILDPFICSVDTSGYGIDASVLGIETAELAPPAYSCQGDGGSCQCDKDKCRMEPKISRTGDGWWTIDADNTTCRLFWFYIPLQSGKMKVGVQSAFHGEYGQDVCDRWYTKSYAYQNMLLGVNIRRNQEEILSNHIFIFKNSGSKNSFDRRIDQRHFLTTDWFDVRDGDLIWIVPRVKAVVGACSNHANSYIDFQTGPHNYIEIEKLTVQVHRPFAGQAFTQKQI